MVQFDFGFKKEERKQMLKILKDSVCCADNKKRCSINCDALHICDACYDDGELTPFCFWSFKDVIYERSVVIKDDADTVCESHELVVKGIILFRKCIDGAQHFDLDGLEAELFVNEA